jgi:NADH-quinone oxidoreductase subunit N
MTIENLLLMRHEVVLTIIAMIILIAELAIDDKAKVKVIPIAIGLFLVHTIIGFLPLREGSLFGGMFNTNGTISMMKNILNVGVLIVLLQSWTWIRHPDNHPKISEYFLLLISTLIGMDFMISSGDFLMFYLGLELATIPLAALAAFERYKNRSAEAGVKLILSSALSSAILLYGISMIYGTTGSIYFSNISTAFSTNPLQILAFIFFFSGMAFKISIVPFHLWAADVYEGAPVNITSYLSVISKGAAVFILMMILYKVFPAITEMWQDVLWVTSALTMTIGNLFAMRQKNLKRFLAFSSISQAGFIFLGIIGSSSLGMSSVIYFALVYIFSNLGAFGVIAAVSNATGKENIEDYNGLYRTNPKLSLVMMLALFSLAGIPPVAGFFGKFFLFTAAAQQGFYYLVLIALLNTIVSLYYYLLVIKAMFLTTSEDAIGYFKSDLPTRLGLIICVGGIIIVGLYSPIYEIIKNLSFGI